MSQPARMTRRTFFRGAAVILGGVALAPAIAACTTSDQPEPRGYDGDPRPLPIPPLYEGEMDGDRRVFALTTRAGQAEILPGVTTPTWGFNGDLLGPTLRMRRGEDVRVDITNELDEMTTIHWHGMKLPAWADGGPHSPIEPGATWSPEWTVDQPAATLWYHPHPHEKTALHCYRGLAGMLLVDDEVTDRLDLPAEYGVDDIPVVITDAKFHDDGRLDEEIDPTLGLLGDTPLVNGITNASFAATTRRVRLRLLNGASMRFHHLQLADARPFHVISSDSGLLPAPQEVDSVLLSPAERVDILVDLAPGEETILESVPLDNNFGIPAGENVTDFGFGDSFTLLTVTGPGDNAPEPSAVPTTLDPNAEATPDVGSAIRREFALNTFRINDQLMDMNRIDVTIDHRDPEVWVVTNENSDWPHNFHIHNARFKVLSLDGTDVTEVLTTGWKDTVALPPNSTVELAVEFGWHPDPAVPYMFHCHMLLHEDEGMMGQFVIVEPGQQAALEPMSGHSH